MHIIPRRKLQEVWVSHSAAEVPLKRWHQLVEGATWTSFADVRAMFASADQYQRVIICNVGGNKYRLIAAAHFNRRRVFIRHVLTHGEYDAGAWKSDY